MSREKNIMLIDACTEECSATAIDINSDMPYPDFLH